MAYSMIRASRVFHANMLYNVLRSPMEFFDTTPMGRILNRFSRDIETIDAIIPQLSSTWLMMVFAVLSTLIVISYSTPIFLAAILPLGILYYIIQVSYMYIQSKLWVQFICYIHCLMYDTLINVY